MIDFEDRDEASQDAMLAHLRGAEPSQVRWGVLFVWLAILLFDSMVLGGAILLLKEIISRA